MISISDFEKKFGFALCANINVIIECLQEGDVFVDVGANTGLLTQEILKKLNFNLGQVILFEPVQYLADECYKKFGDSVVLERKGLSNVNEQKLIYASTRNLAYNKIYEEGMEIHPHTKEIVECVRFSDWVGNNKIDFVKIDVEGHDMQVIEGMYEWLDKIEQKPYILFEGNWSLKEEDALISLMKEKYGYNYKVFDRDVLLIPNRIKKILI